MVRNKIFGETSVKTRTLVRKQGWTPVDVDSLEIKWDMQYWYNDQDNKDNRVHYKEITEWCDQLIGKGNYASTLQNGSIKHNVKRFIFKNPKHATLFRMRWLTS